MTVSEPTVLYRRHGAVSRVVANRPQVMNALDDAMMGQWPACVRLAKEDAETRVIVITGRARPPCAVGELTFEKEIEASAAPRLMPTSTHLLGRSQIGTHPVKVALNGAADALRSAAEHQPARHHVGGPRKRFTFSQVVWSPRPSATPSRRRFG